MLRQMFFFGQLSYLNILFIIDLVGKLQANCLSLVEPQLNPSMFDMWLVTSEIFVSCVLVFDQVATDQYQP